MYQHRPFISFPCSVRTAEFCLPLTRLDDALGDVIDAANHYAKRFSQYSLLPIYVRIVKTDDLYLSPANGKCPAGGNHEHACYIEVKKTDAWFSYEAKNLETYLTPIPSLSQSPRKCRHLLFGKSSLFPSSNSVIYPGFQTPMFFFFRVNFLYF